jgi:hypothetical protein
LIAFIVHGIVVLQERIFHRSEHVDVQRGNTKAKLAS